MKYFSLKTLRSKATCHFCIFSLSATLLLSGCAPSGQKMEQAKTKYSELVATHNEAVEAHRQISDPTLDSTLTELSKQTASFKDINLHDLKESEIDDLIAEMDGLITSYQENITKMEEIKKKEEDAILTPIVLSLVNKTDFTFTSLSLYEEDTADSPNDILTDLDPLIPGQSIAGLTIYRNAQNTPWVLSLTSDSQTFSITLPVAEYSVDGVRLMITYQEEDLTLSLEMVEASTEASTEPSDETEPSEAESSDN